MIYLRLNIQEIVLQGKYFIFPSHFRGCTEPKAKPMTQTAEFYEFVNTDDASKELCKLLKNIYTYVFDHE